MKNLILSLFLLTLFSCVEEEKKDPKVVYTVCSIEDQAKNKCSRFMDRRVYLATSIGLNPEKNNEFQKLLVKEVLREVEEKTLLGEGYFSFTEIDPSLIPPITEATYAGEFRTFIQIFPDDEFNEFANNFGYVPDQNAITVLNGANKKQFYIILRASCFDPNNTNCTNDPGAIMGDAGTKALIARQLGYLVGVQTNCVNINKTMCPEFPRDEQWSLGEKNSWTGLFNNALETIATNPNFYEEFFLE